MLSVLNGFAELTPPEEIASWRGELREPVGMHYSRIEFPFLPIKLLVGSIRVTEPIQQ